MSSRYATILVATGNRHKLEELRRVAERFGVTLVSPKEVAAERNLPPPPKVDEDGETFAANARLKAIAFSLWSGMPTIGDDSGIEVTALGNAPGIYSARYAGTNASDNDRIEKLLRELDNALARDASDDRSGRFRCALVLCDGSSVVLEAEGTLEGTILSSRRGAGGFGYDPIIELHALGKTLAEVDFDTTCREGFRAIAAEKLFAALVAKTDR